MHLKSQSSAVIPGDRRETRDPFLNADDNRSGMDPGSARLRRLSGMTEVIWRLGDRYPAGRSVFTTSSLGRYFAPSA